MTSEPVGNRPRSEPSSGNSHKAREAAAGPPPAEERDPVEKIIVGKVVMKKPPLHKRILQNMVAEDAHDVGDFLMTDVVWPAIRNLIRDVAVGGIDRTLYGTARPRASRTSFGGGSSIRSKYQDIPQERTRSLSREERGRHDFDNIVVDSREEVLSVIQGLMGRIDDYGSASVADFYRFLGVTGSHADLAWGWTDLRDAEVRHSRDGFRFDLPAPQPLRR